MKRALVRLVTVFVGPILAAGLVGQGGGAARAAAQIRCTPNGQGGGGVSCRLWEGNVPVMADRTASGPGGGDQVGTIADAGAHTFIRQCRGTEFTLNNGSATYTNNWWALTRDDDTGTNGWVNLVYFAGGNNDEGAATSGSGALPVGCGSGGTNGNLNESTQSSCTLSNRAAQTYTCDLWQTDVPVMADRTASGPNGARQIGRIAGTSHQPFFEQCRGTQFTLRNGLINDRTSDWWALTTLNGQTGWVNLAYFAGLAGLSGAGIDSNVTEDGLLPTCGSEGVGGGGTLASPEVSCTTNPPGQTGKPALPAGAVLCQLWGDGNVPVFADRSATGPTDGAPVGTLNRGGWANHFFHQCRGAEFTLANGPATYTNNWWALTTADNGKNGWVSVTYFKGGGDDQQQAGLDSSIGCGNGGLEAA